MTIKSRLCNKLFQKFHFGLRFVLSDEVGEDCIGKHRLSDHAG